MLRISEDVCVHMGTGGEVSETYACPRRILRVPFPVVTAAKINPVFLERRSVNNVHQIQLEASAKRERQSRDSHNMCLQKLTNDHLKESEQRRLLEELLVVHLRSVCCVGEVLEVRPQHRVVGLIPSQVVRSFLLRRGVVSGRK